MARAIVAAGLLIAVTAGTASAAEDEADTAAVAALAGVPLVDLQGAMSTTGYDARTYLCLTGELEGEICPKPVQRAASVSGGAPAGGVWARLAQCEASGNWYIDAYHDGGLQFHPSTWRAFKPAGYPEYAYQASPAQQIVVGERVQRVQGWQAWPVCSRRIGLR